MRMRLCTRALLLLAKAASYVAALLAALLVTPLRPLGGWAVVLMWGKVAAGALAPFLVIGGTLGATVGLLRRDFRAALAGLAGAAAAARHIRRLAAPHALFDAAFGPNWRDRIPPALAARMLMYRWPWQLGLLPPRAPYQAHISYAMWPKTAENRYCDVRLPPDDAPRTGLGVIYLHGGGWHYGDKALGTRPFFKHLAGQGHVIMDVAYTLAPKTDLYGMIADVKRAIAWMKTNAAALGVDPARLVLMGASAGAHLALLAAYTPNDPAFQPADVTMDTSVRAVVAFYPPVDIAALYRDLQTRAGGFLTGQTTTARLAIATMEPILYATRMLPPYGRYVPRQQLTVGLTGGAPDTAPKAYRVASPLTHVGPHCPPTLLLHGADDSFIAPDHSRRLHAALRAAGVTSVAIEYPGAEHAFDRLLARWSPAALAAIYDVERFLALM